MTVITPQRFRAIWPVVDEDGLGVRALLDQAIDDLPKVARRYGLRPIMRTVTTGIVEGRHVPGSGGARLVVVADVAVVRIADIPDTDADERRDATDTGACGTDAGYQRHQRANERPCDPCAAAHKSYRDAWKRRRQEASA